MITLLTCYSIMIINALKIIFKLFKFNWIINLSYFVMWNTIFEQNGYYWKYFIVVANYSFYYSNSANFMLDIQLDFKFAKGISNMDLDNDFNICEELVLIKICLNCCASLENSFLIKLTSYEKAFLSLKKYSNVNDFNEKLSRKKELLH